MDTIHFGRQRALSAPETAFSPHHDAVDTETSSEFMQGMATPRHDIITGNRMLTPGGGTDDEVESWYKSMFASEIKLNKKAERARRRSTLTLSTSITSREARSGDDAITPGSNSRYLHANLMHNVENSIDTMAVLGVASRCPSIALREEPRKQNEVDECDSRSVVLHVVL